MAASPVTKINNNQVRFNDPTSVVFIPWSEGAPGTDGYDIHDIVGDTFSLTQDDPDRTEIPWEFGDDPLDENISLGNRNLTMQCLDYQNSIMKNIFGWEEPVSTASGTDTDPDFIYAPAQYSELVCTIILAFEGKSVVMPKVKMDSKTVFENLRTDIARGELGGVLYATATQFGLASTLKETGLFFVKHPSSGTKTFTLGATESSGSITGGTAINIGTDGTVTIGS